MNPHWLIIGTSFAYIVIFGGLSLLRREGLSTQFALEVLGVTALVEILSILTNTPIQPLFFLILIYLLSMRVRLLVDIANMLSNRGRQRDAINLLQFSLRLFPDHISRLVALVNMGIVQLRRKNPQSAQELFEMVLSEAESKGGLGIKYEAACRYNLALSLQQQGKEAEAVRQFNETTLTFPNSIYSQAAEAALAKRREGKGSALEDSEDIGGGG